MGFRQAYARTDAMVQAARARTEAAQKATFTQESANNLKALITAKLLPGGAKLRAFGTTLNARYYGDETYNLAPWYIPREAALELKAKAALIKAPGSIIFSTRSKSAIKSKSVTKARSAKKPKASFKKKNSAKNSKSAKKPNSARKSNSAKKSNSARRPGTVKRTLRKH